MSGPSAALIAAREAAIRVRGRRLPGWVLALAVYLVARLFTAVVTLIVAHTQVANLWTTASPGYGAFVSMWDGDRYRRIAEQGYPLPVPVDLFGRPTQSEWAFFPAYPVLVRLVMVMTRLPFTVAAPGLSLVLGCWATVLAYRLFARHARRANALAAVALFAVFPTSPVLQYSYSESTCLLGLMGVLLFLDRQRYGRATAFAVLLGLSRPIGLAVVPVIALHLACRWWCTRRWRSRAVARGLPGPVRRPGNLAWGMVLLVVSALAALLFPAVVAVAAGRVDGYTAVQVAWRASDRMEYLTPWLWMSRYVFGAAGPWVLAVGVVLVVVGLASPAARGLGLTMWSWCVGYTCYLAAVVDPFSSLPRFLLFYAPLGLAVAGSGAHRGRRANRRRWVCVLLVGTAFVVGQVLWIAVLWRFTPPSDYPP